jgi:methanogenic corrinoid protein MtbC1
MVNMEQTVQKIKDKSPETIIVIGGAPITEDFSDKIGADAYFPSPHTLPDFLEKSI